MYLPDTSHPLVEADSARDKLQADVAHYSQKRGHIIFLGDFNAHVAAVPAPLGPDLARAPVSGMRRGNAAGRSLFAMCEEQDHFFPSGRTADTFRPTCRGLTIVDHLIGSRDTLAWNRPVTTLAPTDANVALCASDHVPLLITVPTCAAPPAAPVPTRIRWRLGNLSEPATLTAYNQALVDNTHAFYAAVAPMLASHHMPTQADVETAMAALSHAVNDAAFKSMDRRVLLLAKRRVG